MTTAHSRLSATPRRRPKLETHLVQQALAGFRLGQFLDEINALLLDGWRVVPGTYYHVRVKTVAGDHENPKWVNREGECFRDHYFIVLEREETVDPEATRLAIEAAEGRRLPELARANEQGRHHANENGAAT